MSNPRHETYGPITMDASYDTGAIDVLGFSKIGYHFQWTYKNMPSGEIRIYQSNDGVNWYQDMMTPTISIDSSTMYFTKSVDYCYRYTKLTYVPMMGTTDTLYFYVCLKN